MKLSRKSLVSPEQDIKLSSLYIGFIILRFIEGEKRASIFDIFENVKKTNATLNYNATMQALIFLFMSGLIDFDAPYIYKMR